MLIFIQPDGRAQLQVPVNNFRGSNNVNQLTVFTSLPKDNSIFVAFELPDGTQKEPLLMNYVQSEVVDGIEYSTYSLPLPYSVTQQRGVLNVAFSIYTGTKPVDGAYAAGENRTTNIVPIPITDSVPAIIPDGDPSTVEDIARKYQLLATQIDQINATADDALATANRAEDKVDKFLSGVDDTEANQVGKVEVTIDANGQLKVKNMKGETGATGPAGSNAAIFWGIEKEPVLSTQMWSIN